MPKTTIDAESRSEQVNLRITPSERERWEKAASDGGYTSLSEFLRAAAEAERSGGHSQVGVPGDLADRLDTMADTLATLASTVKRLDDRMKDVEARLRVQGNDFTDLVGDVLDALPVVNTDDLDKPTVDSLRATDEADMLEDFIDSHGGADDLMNEAGLIEEFIVGHRGATLDHIADTLDVERWEAFAALDYLRQNTGQVRAAPGLADQDELVYVRRG